jgi:alpha-amylase/alpha-mannosidase (GH57 family)
MADVVVSFLWHQHQPYYPDDVSGENPMPWVRLHGVKDYYGMALHLLEVPEMRCTINLVPSLIKQLQDYTERNASDRFLDVSRVPADSLTEADCLFLLDHFFMANHEQMIRPYPRFAELHQRRAAGRNSAREAMRRFQERDFRDLQVWFNLAWVHPLAIERDETLKELSTKGKSFSEGDKTALLAKHLEILKQVIPLHRKLADSGQVELTTTPYFHPILPLLLDKKLAREAMPDVKLPRHTAGYPEDAALHLKRAIEAHTKLFGKAPQGLWPAEGSVCQSMLPLLRQHGITWFATDEEILSASTHGFVSRDSKGHIRNPDRMYQPYKVKEGNAELQVVFRDHALSDLIGFHYQRSDPVAAADNFIGNLHGIGHAVHTSEPALVPVILDGENCWEHYPGGGVAFLRALYDRCTKTPGVKPLSIGSYLEKYPAHDTLPRLFAGSWISHNFAIWIGHEEDNTAWDALHRAREHLRQKSEERGARSEERGVKVEGSGSKASAAETVVADPRSSDTIQKAWEEIYIAEGSDWFWWYGDDHSSAQDAQFDYLFRKHLQNVYLLLGEVPPPELAKPISRRGHRVAYTQPRAFLDIKIDGRYTFFEWLSAGQYMCRNERSTMAMALHGPLEGIHFGFNLDLLLLRIDCDEPAKIALGDIDTVRIVFAEPAGREVRIHHPARPAQRVEWLQAAGGQPSTTLPSGLAVGLDQILELAVPFAALDVQVGQPIQFFVEVMQDGQSRDRAPREGAIALTRPSADFEQIMWDV